MMIQAEFPMFGGRVGCSGSFDCDKNAVSAGRPFSRPLPHPLSSRPLRIHASAARRQVYFEEWRSTIMRLRNFPCVFDYTMTNEGPLLNHQFAMQLYTTAKTLDPGRLVSTSVIRTRIPEHLDSVAQEDSCGQDGIGDDGTSNHSNPYDFLTPGYEGGAMPLDNSHLYRPGNVSDRPFPQGFRYWDQPLVNHETGNVGAFPDVELQIPRW